MRNGRLIMVLISSLLFIPALGCGRSGTDTQLPADDYQVNLPMFRANPHRTGVYQTKGVPQLNGVKWSFQAKSDEAISFIGSEGNILYGTNENWLYALDAATGGEVWKKSMQIQRAPILYQGSIFYEANKRLIGVLDAGSGQELWELSNRERGLADISSRERPLLHVRYYDPCRGYHRQAAKLGTRHRSRTAGCL